MAPLTAMTNPTGPPDRYQPTALPIHPPSSAPALPNAMMMIDPPGSHPGIKSLATLPTTSPNRIQPNMCMAHLLEAFSKQEL